MGRIVSNTIKHAQGVSYANVPEALAANGLDWTVEKRPLFARIPTGKGPDGKETGIFKRADNLFGIVRSDNNHTLGTATARYTCGTNADGFDPLEVLAKDGRIKIVGAGALDGGARVWMQAQTPERVSIGGEPIDYYVMGLFSHDGSASNKYFDLAIRFFCTNQLRAISRDTRDVNITMRHTASLPDRVREAKRLIERVYLNQAQFVATAESLLAQTFSRAEMETLVKTLVPAPSLSDPTTTTRQINGWNEKFSTIMRDAYGAPDLNDIRYTKWGAMNAIADFEQHFVRTKGTTAEREETMFTRAIETGPLATRAFALLTN